MAARGLCAKDLAASGDFEPFRDGLACFTAGNWLRHEARKIDALCVLTTGFGLDVEPLTFAEIVRRGDN